MKTNSLKLSSIVKFSLFLFLILSISPSLHSQARKKTNWLEDKKSHISRWRIGAGIHAGEPTGVNVQFYKLSGICTQTIRIKKKFSIDISASQEGYLYNKRFNDQITGWEKGGIRGNIDFKLYFPIYLLNPYVGVGGETGTRVIENKKAFSSDVVGRIGVEQKILGLRTSTKSLLHASIFIEGKYNHGITHKYSYLLPTIGIRVHFL